MPEDNSWRRINAKTTRPRKATNYGVTYGPPGNGLISMMAHNMGHLNQYGKGFQPRPVPVRPGATVAKGKAFRTKAGRGKR